MLVSGHHVRQLLATHTILQIVVNQHYEEFAIDICSADWTDSYLSTTLNPLHRIYVKLLMGLRW